MKTTIVKQPETVVEPVHLKHNETPKDIIYDNKPTVSKVAESSKLLDENRKSEEKPAALFVDMSKVVVGAAVKHSKFGDGTIVSIDQKRTKARVKFALGEKTFIIEDGNQYNAFANGLMKLK